MGFFSKVRRKFKKLIPKEIRPYAPYIASVFLPGAAASGMFSSAIGNQFMAAAATKGLTDDEADLKDILRTGAIAAAPAAIGKGISSLADITKLPAGQDPTAFQNFLNKGRAVGDTGKTRSLARTIEGKLNPSGFVAPAKMAAVQGTIDYGIKAAELNEDALADYNRQMLESDVN